MIAWLMIAGIVGGMMWFTATFMYMVLMWSKDRQMRRQR